MKLIVQIPCLNEELHLEAAIAAVPKIIPGITSVEILIIDDGSCDRTSEVARACGVHHIIRFNRNRGLAQAFQFGLDKAIALGADIIVNFDADNQYPGSGIGALIAPIIRGDTDIVIGNRNPEHDQRNSWFKRTLYCLGRLVMGALCSTPCPDPVSGFRAFSREAALEVNTLSSFSYTLEAIIQAEHKRLKLAYVPIVANDPIRASRLFSSTYLFLFYSARTILETLLLYNPLKFFFLIGTVVVLIGTVPVLRFLYIFFRDGTAGHMQSLIIGCMCIVAGLIFYIAGIQSHLIARNRMLLEQILKLAKSRGS